jgi:uncharacterized protein YbjT (DUF2867 family)
MEFSNIGKTVLVTGATGQQGGAVAARMLEKGWKLRALTRNLESAAAKKLSRQGVEVLKGDLEDPASIEAAVRGVYGVFSVQDHAAGAQREIQQGKNLADAALKAGVTHFVYNSVGGANRNTGIDIWERKWLVEQYVRKLGLPATIFRPSTFFDDFYFDILELGILKGTYRSPVRGDKEYQMIASTDIGGFVALAFERPQEFIGMELEIAGSALTNNQAAEVFTKVLKRPVKFRALPMPIARLMVGKEVYHMFKWLNASGYKADVVGLRQRYPELHLKSLEDWLYLEGWQKHARPVGFKNGAWGWKQ